MLEACIDGGNRGRVWAWPVKGRDVEQESTLWMVIGYRGFARVT